MKHVESIARLIIHHEKKQEKSVMNERISVIHYAFFATYVTIIFFLKLILTNVSYTSGVMTKTASFVSVGS